MEEARSYLQELEGVRTEMDSLKKRLKQLAKRDEILCKNLQDYCRATHKPGVKYNNTVVMLENRTVRTRKKKAEQRAAQIEVLRSRGVNPDNGLLAALEEARRGTAVETQRLKVQRKTTR